MLKNSKSTPAVRLPGCGIDYADEIKRSMALGATGAGKSTTIRQLLTNASRRRDRAIIADPDGGLPRALLRSVTDDIILYPLDARSARWSPIEDAPRLHQADEVARGLIPDLSETHSQCTSYAWTLLASILRQVRPAGLTDAAVIHQLIVSAPLEELRTLLSGTAAAPFLAPGSEKLFAGTRSTASDAVAGLQYVAHGPSSNAPFSVMEWARSNRPGWLFLPDQADQIAALHRLTAAWVRLAIFAPKGRGEGDSRTWFVVDELDALVRSTAGGRPAAAAQVLWPVRARLRVHRTAVLNLRRGDRRGLIENTGCKLILHCSASAGGGLAASASQILGKRDVWRSSTNSGLSSPDPYARHVERTELRLILEHPHRGRGAGGANREPARPHRLSDGAERFRLSARRVRV